MDTHEIIHAELKALRDWKHEVSKEMQNDWVRLELAVRANESNATALKKVEGEVNEIKKELSALRLDFTKLQTRMAIYTGIAVLLATGLWDAVGKHFLK